MTKFILLYKGAATPQEEMTEEESREVMEKWSQWMGKIGDALVDVGQPMANGEAVVDNSTTAPATELSGYSIIQAEDMEAAKDMVDGHPFLSEGEGNFSIEIHELLPVPEM